MADWKYPRDGDLPPEGVVVETTDSGGRHRNLIFDGGRWWFPDRSMYVYFIPQSWRLTVVTGPQGGSSPVITGPQGGSSPVITGPQGGFPPPRLEADCTAHGAPLAMCDHCANIHVMARWAGSLSGNELAGAIEAIASGRFWYAASEKQALLAEAVRRLRGK